MILHTVVISYQRLALLQRTIESYYATVTVPHKLLIVDNGSNDDVLTWLTGNFPNHQVIYLGENRYPGYACNRGFAAATPETTHLHRSDSDMEYLPHWCEHAQEMFEEQQDVGLVGLRTAEEENFTPLNTGGTAIIKKEVWDLGLRYTEHAWKNDMTEDWRICQDIARYKYSWSRVRKPSVVHIAAHDLDDPYYIHSLGVRKLLKRAKKGAL